MITLQVLWGRLYKLSSAAEKGTLYQLRNLIHRTNVPLDPEKNMNASEDFMLLVLHAHVVAAAKVVQKSNPKASVQELAGLVLEKFTRFTQAAANDDTDNDPKSSASGDDKTGSDDPSRSDSNDNKAKNDGVFTYASEVLSLGLIWHGFHDAIREGDGDRILRYWKFLLVLFKRTKHRNYAKEAVNLLVQYHYTMSERKRAQLLWSRCVNTRGVPGANIPCDLHMEHLNRRLKRILRAMGANINASAVVRAGKSLAAVHHVCQIFERQTATCLQSDHHAAPSFAKDLSQIVKVLEDENIYVHDAANRQHKSFDFKCGLMESHSQKKLQSVVEANIRKL